jgi:hypothetical protein
MTWNLKPLGFGNFSRQGAKTPSSDEKNNNSFKLFLFLFSDLCDLGVFAGDIPSLGCGFAAPCTLW